ncbi:MAG: hypothetical protein ABSF80_02685 [Chitinispirillaceae bacterium]|jgi:hypothetical protein
MKKLVLCVVVAALCLIPLSGASSQPVSRATVAEEMSEHPRIEAAIKNLEDAIAYMEAAPHNFGGHKAAAIAASRKAIVQLRKAMAYRAKVEGK